MALTSVMVSRLGPEATRSKWEAKSRKKMQKRRQAFRTTTVPVLGDGAHTEKDSALR